MVTTSQLGMVFQAATVAFSSSADCAIGRCVSAISAAWSAGTSAANWCGNLSCWMYRSVPVVPSGLVNGTGSSVAGSVEPG